MARTLSIEWARLGIRPVAVLPARRRPAEIAELVAFLASPAGAYYSGCVFDLSAGNVNPRLYGEGREGVRYKPFLLVRERNAPPSIPPL